MTVNYILASVLCIGLSTSMFVLSSESPREVKSFLDMSLDEIIQGFPAEQERQAHERAELPKAFGMIKDYLEAAGEVEAGELLDEVNLLKPHDLVEVTNEGRTILHLLASKPNNRIITVFDVLAAQLKADEIAELAETTSRHGTTPLHIASNLGNIVFFEELFKDNNIKLRHNMRNALGETPLYIAAERGNLPLVELLYKKEEDLCAEANNGTTPLMASLQYRESWDVTRYLLQQDAIKQCIQFQDQEGNTVLHLAAFISVPEDLIKALLNQGADISAENKAGETPIGIAQELAENATDPYEKEQRRAFLQSLLSDL